MRYLLPAILKLSTNNEGGYSNHPRDPGGPTNHGITQATLSAWLRRPASIAEVKALTLDTANKIYEANYWRPIAGDRLPAGLDYAAFDFGINSGPRRAIMELQAVLASKNKAVGIDGIVGEKTLAAIEAWDIEDLIRAYIDRRMAFFRKLNTWKDFGRGWTYRVLGTDPQRQYKKKPGVLGDALNMAAQKPVKSMPLPIPTDGGMPDLSAIQDIFTGKARDNNISWLSPIQNKAQIGTIGTVVVGSAIKAANDYIAPMQQALDFVTQYKDVWSGLGYITVGLVIGISVLTIIKQTRESRESGGAA